jgi:glycine/D-amino acid oxidase-like deaminating enzyme
VSTSQRQRGRCAVVGAGLLGLAAARSLARRGWDTVVFEAADAPGHDRSGSKGDARVFRLGYPDPVYVEMALLARALWRDLETASGAHLLHVTGQLTFGSDVEAVTRALHASGVTTESLSPKEAARRFPSIDAAGPVLFEPDSGVLAADRCLHAMQATGRFRLCAGAEVVALEDDLQAGEVTVVLSGGAPPERADVVVNCAGHRALPLLGAPAGPGPSLPQVAYFARRGATAPLPPVFIEWGPDMMYGLPVPSAGGGPNAGLYKVSHHTPGPPLDPADTDPAPFQEDDPALLARLSDAARRLLPGLDPAPVAAERCVYDSTADGDFVLDRVGRIVVGCGTSGHAFKFGPLLGELLADLAEERTPVVDVSRFSLSRLPR